MGAKRITTKTSLRHFGGLMKFKKKDKQRVIAFLERSRKNITAEEIAQELDISYSNVHRIFAQLRSEGWGITPQNFIPYWRQWGPNINRSRIKGEKYNHDWAEPDWSRTKFFISKPSKET